MNNRHLPFYFFFFTILIASFINPINLISQNRDSICQIGYDKLYSLDLTQNFDKAINTIEQLAPTLKEGKCWLTYADCFNALAAIHYYQRDYAKAKINVEKAVETLAVHSKNSIVYAAAITNLSIFQELMGDYPGAIESRLESISIQAEIAPENIDFFTKVFENIGLIYQTIGDFKTANEYLRKALNKIEGDEDDHVNSRGRILREIASCQLSNNEYQSALDNLESSIELMKKLPPKQYYNQTKWFAHCELSKAYLKMKNFDTSFRHVENAIQLQQKHDFLNKYNAWLIRGKIEFQSGQLEKAINSFDQSLKDAEEEFGDYERHVSFAHPLLAKANLYLQKKDYSTALELFNKAMKHISVEFNPESIYENPLVEQLIKNPISLEILSGKTNALFEKYQNNSSDGNTLEAAYLTAKLSAEFITALRKSYEADGSKHILFEKANPIYEKAIEISLAMYGKTGDDNYLESALGFSESNKAVLLYESLKNTEAKRFANIPDSTLSIGQEIRTEITYYEKRIFEEKQKKLRSENHSAEEFEDLIFKKKRALQEHEKSLEKKYLSYKKSKDEDIAFSLKKIRQGLPTSSTVLVEYFTGTESSYAFFVSKNDIRAIILPNRHELTNKVEVLNHLISSPPKNNEKYKEDYLYFKDISQQLHNTLLEKGLNEFPRAKHLIIVPDDILNHIPFEVLINQKNKNNSGYSYQSLNYLFKKYDISYNYSASLKHTEDSEYKDDKIFAGFAPSFNSKKYADTRTCTPDELYSLHCNEGEVKNINELFHGNIFMSEKATTENFTTVSDYKILHFATHACLNEDESAMNQIFFTDGSITQRELGLYDLNSSLTVLSACNSGRGKLMRGEGVLSLARGFIKAGSESVLTSLWSVDDCATSDIMQLFYQNIKNGDTKDRAITKAKIDYLENADLNNSHPYYWAAFVQFGDSSSLFEKSRLNWKTILFAALGILLIGGTLYFIRNKKANV